MNFLIHLIKLLILIALCGLLLESFGAEKLMSYYLEKQLGTEVEFENIHIDYLKSDISLENLKISNPADFPDGTTMVIPKLFMDIDLRQIFKWKIVLKSLELDVKEVRLLDLADQGLNVHNLNIFRQEDAAGEPDKTTSSFLPELEVRQLILDFDRATYTDLKNDRPRQKAFEIKVDQAVFNDLKGFDEVGKAIVWLALKQVGVAAEDAAFAPDNLPGAVAA